MAQSKLLAPSGKPLQNPKRPGPAVPYFSRPDAKRGPGGRGDSAKLEGDLKELRTTAIIDMRLRHVTVADIAKHFNISVPTVYQAIYSARRSGLLEKYRHRLMSRLVPKAMATIERLLEKDNLKAAEQVFALFKGEAEREHERTLAKETAEDSLAEWWAKRKEALAGGDVEAPTDVTVTEDSVIDADTLSNPVTATEAAVAPSSPCGAAPGGATGPTHADIAAPRQADAVEAHGQDGLAPGGENAAGAPIATSYHFGPDGFSGFPDEPQFDRHSDEADEGI